MARQTKLSPADHSRTERERGAGGALSENLNVMKRVRLDKGLERPS